jgi:AmmeMemoRadiSam system protein B/AmmeMemoRadiSam system protein A
MLKKMFSEKSLPGAKNASYEHRQPCVAGQFYPADAKTLRHTIQHYFAKAKPPTTQNLRAIITPHAGYIFSGQTAAHAFNQIDPNRKYKRIFLIGSSHRVAFDGASIYNRGHYLTPLGTVKVDLDMANQLTNDNKFFAFHPEAHHGEHSLEVQLPFLQIHLQHDFHIVPIIIAAQSHETIRKIAEALQPYFTTDNLFVISSDFSHYPAYADAVAFDLRTAEAIAQNSPKAFLETIAHNDSRQIHGLATSICGWSSVLALLHLTSHHQNMQVKLVAYTNSGDAPRSDRSRVVGYWAIAFDGKEDEGFMLSDDEKSMLLQIAREAVINVVLGKKQKDYPDNNLTEKLTNPMGAFVTFYHQGKLRGCIGRIEPELPLWEIVQQMAISAATRDYRFDPITKAELTGLDIEISVLTQLLRIDDISDIIPRKHGIFIRKGLSTGTFLPQVAETTGWNALQLLQHCAADKAGIGRDGWKDAEIYVYQAMIIGEKDSEK